MVFKGSLEIRFTAVGPETTVETRVSGSDAAFAYACILTGGEPSGPSKSEVDVEGTDTTV